MKSFTVHEKAALEDADARLVFVREGFSWFALALPVLWLIYHRAWIAAPVYAAIACVCALALWLTGYTHDSLTVAAGLLLLGPVYLVGFADPLIAVMGAALGFLFAWEAHDLWRRWLAMEGYEVIGVIAGKNLSEAERAYFGADPAQRPASRTPLES